MPDLIRLTPTTYDENGTPRAVTFEAESPYQSHSDVLFEGVRSTGVGELRAKIGGARLSAGVYLPSQVMFLRLQNCGPRGEPCGFHDPRLLIGHWREHGPGMASWPLGKGFSIGTALDAPVATPEEYLDAVKGAAVLARRMLEAGGFHATCDEGGTWRGGLLVDDAFVNDIAAHIRLPFSVDHTGQSMSWRLDRREQRPYEAAELIVLAVE